MATKKANSVRKFISIAVTVICLGVFIFAGYKIIDTMMQYSENEKVMNNLQETFYDAGKPNGENRSPQSIRSGFDILLKENPDLVGWITIDNTQIDYPIVQAENNTDYLTRNFYRQDNIAGSIFMDFRNDVKEPGRNTIVYGHRMRNGSMFENLMNYKEEEFFKENPSFTFDTLYDSYEAEIFAVYITTVDFYYIQTDFSSDSEFEQLLTKAQDLSFYETNVEVGPDDHILTLSTCDYVLDPDDGRLVVQAKLTKKG